MNLLCSRGSYLHVRSLTLGLGSVMSRMTNLIFDVDSTNCRTDVYLINNNYDGERAVAFRFTLFPQQVPAKRDLSPEHDRTLHGIQNGHR